MTRSKLRKSSLTQSAREAFAAPISSDVTIRGGFKGPKPRTVPLKAASGSTLTVVLTPVVTDTNYKAFAWLGTTLSYLGPKMIVEIPRVECSLMLEGAHYFQVGYQFTQSGQRLAMSHGSAEVKRKNIVYRAVDDGGNRLCEFRLKMALAAKKSDKVHGKNVLNNTDPTPQTILQRAASIEVTFPREFLVAKNWR